MKTPYYKVVKGNQIIRAALNGMKTQFDFKIGCKKCYGRGYVGTNDQQQKIPCKCMIKQLDYQKI